MNLLRSATQDENVKGEPQKQLKVLLNFMLHESELYTSDCILVK